MFLLLFACHFMQIFLKIIQFFNFTGPVLILSNFVHSGFYFLIITYISSKKYQKISSGESRRKKIFDFFRFANRYF